MAFSPTDRIVAWAGLKWLGILDYESGETNTFPISRTSGFCNPAFAPDGRELAFEDSTNIMLLNMATRKPRPFAAIDNSVYGIAFSPNGSLLASAHNGGGVTLWDRASGRKITTVLAHPPFALDVEFSRDGRFLASGGADGIGKIWEVIPGGLKRVHSLPGHLGWVDLSFSPDGRRVVSSGTSDTTLKLWDTKTGFEVGALYGYGGSVAGFAFSRDGNAIYSAGEAGEVRVWRAPPLGQLEMLERAKASGTAKYHPTANNN